MDVTGLIGSIAAFIKANPLITLAFSGMVLLVFYRRPALSFFVLFVILLVAGVYYVIMDMSSSAVSGKERLLKKGSAPQEIMRIDPSSMLY